MAQSTSMTTSQTQGHGWSPPFQNEISPTSTLTIPQAMNGYNLKTWTPGGTIVFTIPLPSSCQSNQACKDVIKSDPPTEQLFFRRDVFLVKHKGSLGMGHEYIDTPQAMVDITAKVIKKMYENESLEMELESDRNFERELEKHSELPSNNCLISFKSIRVCRTSASGDTSAIETGAIERFRTDQMTEGNQTCELTRPVAIGFMRKRLKKTPALSYDVTIPHDS